MQTPEQRKEYYQKNKEKFKSINKKRYEEIEKDKKKKYYQENKEEIKENSTKNRNLTKQRARSKKYYQKNKEKLLLKSKNYYQENKEEISIKTKIYRKENSEKIKNNIKNRRDKINKSNNERRKIDSFFKFSTDIRNLIRISFKNKSFKKNTKTEKILGCSIKDFKIYIESKFESWMTWENHGNPKDKILEPSKTWDIDHIIPISTAKTEEDVIKLNHYTNLQPLCSYFNRNIKKDNIL